MSDNAKPLHEVFKRRALDVGEICGERVSHIPAIFDSDPLKVALEDGTNPTLIYWFTKHHDAAVAFEQITPAGLADVVFGEENVLNSEQLGSISEEVDNRNGVGDVEVNFRDLFAEKNTSETTDSEGGSISTTVEAEQDIEGVASFKESITAEAHKEFSETHGSETDKENEGSEGTTVPGPVFNADGSVLTPGKRVRIVETRSRSDVEVEVSATGKFKHVTKIGQHSGGHFVHHRYSQWDSWEDFVDCVTGHAPDNWDLAASFKKHPPLKKLVKQVTTDLSAAVRYRVKWEGRVVRTYAVEAF